MNEVQTAFLKVQSGGNTWLINANQIVSVSFESTAFATFKMANGDSIKVQNDSQLMERIQRAVGKH
jgi:hypothetical protein